MNPESVPRWPRVEAVISRATDSGAAGHVAVNGIRTELASGTEPELRQMIIATVAKTAHKLGRPVRVSTKVQGGSWPIIVHPDGRIEDDSVMADQGRRRYRLTGHEPAPDGP